MIGKNMIKFDTLDSTNTYVKQHSYTLNHGDIIWSLEQTSGRGRYGNSWQSNSGNLYFSILLKNKEYIHNIFELHIKASVIIIELLKLYDIEATIKYPNDILVGNKKICGILVETQGKGQNEIVVLGIGINVNQNKYIGLSDKAISMNLIKHKKFDLEDILSTFIDVYNRKKPTEVYYKNYLKKSLILGKHIIHNQNQYQVKNVLRNGQLICANKSEQITVDYDRISFTHLYFNE